MEPFLIRKDNPYIFLLYNKTNKYQLATWVNRLEGVNPINSEAYF